MIAREEWRKEKPSSNESGTGEDPVDYQVFVGRMMIMNCK